MNMTYEQDLLDIAKEMRNASEQNPQDVGNAIVAEMLKAFPGLGKIEKPTAYKSATSDQVWLVVPYQVETLPDKYLKAIKFLKVEVSNASLKLILDPAQIGDTSTPDHRAAVLEALLKAFVISYDEVTDFYILRWKA